MMGASQRETDPPSPCHLLSSDHGLLSGTEGRDVKMKEILVNPREIATRQPYLKAPEI